MTAWPSPENASSRDSASPAASPSRCCPTAIPTAKSGQPAKLVEFAKSDAKPAAASTAKGAPISAPAAAAEPAPPSDEIFNTVKNFSVSAVKTGENARALINGKTYHAGDTVAPGITLHEIKDGLLIFTDDAGSAYPRRF